MRWSQRFRSITFHCIQMNILYELFWNKCANSIEKLRRHSKWTVSIESEWKRRRYNNRLTHFSYWNWSNRWINNKNAMSSDLRKDNQIIIICNKWMLIDKLDTRDFLQTYQLKFRTCIQISWKKKFSNFTCCLTLGYVVNITIIAIR